MKQDELRIQKILDSCEWSSSFHNGFARIKRAGMYGFLHESGSEITPKYEMVYNFVEGRARVKSNNRFAYIDENGEEITEFKYNLAQDFQENGLAVVVIDNLCGAINKAGEEVIPVKHVTLAKFLR